MKILILIILLVREVIGKETCSNGTDEPVTDCPRDEKSWIKAGERKNCTQFMSKDCADLQYHCLINAYGNGIVEVCAKLTYLQGYCAEYNPLTLSIKNHVYRPCINFTIGGKCPSRYKSTDAYLYPHCYDLVKKASKKSKILPMQKETSNGTLIAVVMSVIILLLISSFGFFMVYQVRRHHLSCREALQNVPLFGNHLSEINYLATVTDQEQEYDIPTEQNSSHAGPNRHSEEWEPLLKENVYADTGTNESLNGTTSNRHSEEVSSPPLTESVSQYSEEEEIRNKYPKLEKTLQRDIAEVDKDVLVKHDDRLKRGEITELIPKLDSLMDRLDAFRTLPKKVKVRLQQMDSFSERFRSKEVNVFVNRIPNFKKKLKRTEREVKSYFEDLAKEVEIEHIEDYVRVDESKGYSERIVNLEKKIEKLESILGKSSR